MKLAIRILILVTALAGSALAQSLPSYYPVAELRNAGEIDAVIATEQRIIIDDSSFIFADDAIVHSLQSYSVSRSRLRPGTRVAFKVDQNRVITEFWLLPRNYDTRRRR